VFSEVKYGIDFVDVSAPDRFDSGLTFRDSDSILFETVSRANIDFAPGAVNIET
jgi:hypothetical protein